MLAENEEINHINTEAASLLAQLRESLYGFQRLFNALTSASIDAANIYRAMIIELNTDLGQYAQIETQLTASPLLCSHRAGLIKEIHAKKDECRQKLKEVGQDLVRAECFARRLEGLRILEAVQMLWESYVQSQGLQV